MPSTAVKVPKRFVRPAASTSTPSRSDTPGRVGRGAAGTLPEWPVCASSLRPVRPRGTGRDVVDGATSATCSPAPSAATATASLPCCRPLDLGQRGTGRPMTAWGDRRSRRVPSGLRRIVDLVADGRRERESLTTSASSSAASARSPACPCGGSPSSPAFQPLPEPDPARPAPAVRRHPDADRQGAADLGRSPCTCEPASSTRTRARGRVIDAITATRI